MLRRLICLAVFPVLLYVTGVTTFGSEGKLSDLIPIEENNPDAPHYGQWHTIVPAEEPFEKPLDSLNPVEPNVTLDIPEYFCDYVDYSLGMVAYSWNIYDKYGGTELGQKFEVKSDWSCTLKTAYIGIDGTRLKGNPGMRVTVYNDNGFGAPGAVRGYVDVPASQIAHSGIYYKSVNLMPLQLVYANEAGYHIGVKKIGGVNDTLVILSDDGQRGDERSWTILYGNYHSMREFWGPDVNFLIGVDECCERTIFSQCRIEKYYCNPSLYWEEPDSIGVMFHNQRLTALERDTLKSVSVALYQPGTIGSPDLDIYVWRDNGAGFPDTTQLLASVTVPNSQIVYYPEFNEVDLTSFNIMLDREDFHVGWKTHQNSPGDRLAGLSDDGSCSRGRRSSVLDGSWMTIQDDYGIDVNFLITATLCKDNFSECFSMSHCDSPNYSINMPEIYEDYYRLIGSYARFSPATNNCRLSEISIALFWNRNSYNKPLYSYNSEIKVLTSGQDGIGQIFSKIISPADYGITPATPNTSSYKWLIINLDSANVLFDSDIWVGIESMAPDEDHGITLMAELDYSHIILDAIMVIEGTTPEFVPTEYWWGYDLHFLIKTDFCCTPLPQLTCIPGEDWPTMGRNFVRGLHTSNSLGNAKSRLTKAWEYASNGIGSLNSPVIYKDTVVYYFGDRLVALDINNGQKLWERVADGVELGGQCHSTPTVWNGVVYTAGGDARSFSAFRLNDGSTLWSRDAASHSNHSITLGPSVILNISGSDMLSYSDDNGWVYAVDPLTGDLFPGWIINPVKLPAPVIRGFSGYGTRIFAGTQKTAVNGDIYALNAVNGNVAWQFSTGPSGLQGSKVVPVKDYGGLEGFSNGIAVDVRETRLYTVSNYDIADSTRPVQDGGILYSICAGDGLLYWTRLCPNGGGGYSIPALDLTQTIYQGWTPWPSSDGNLRGPISIDLKSGYIRWANTIKNPPGKADNALMEGLISCENYGSNYFVAGYSSNWIDFFRADNGKQLFHRRLTGYRNGLYFSVAHQTAPVMDDGHLLITSGNKIICLTDQLDRPRLDIPDFSLEQPVNFGSPNHTLVTFPRAIANSGGKPLRIDSIAISTSDNGTLPPFLVSISTVNSERLDRLNTAFDKMSLAPMRLQFFSQQDNLKDASQKSLSINQAAFAMPPFVNGVVYPYHGAQIAPDDTVDIILDINGPLVTRGRHTFFAGIWTDDPDYFLDSARMNSNSYAVPELVMNIVGGCVYEKKIMPFGISSGNQAGIWNSGMLVDADNLPGLEISGDSKTTFYQGGLIFGRSHYRLATHMPNWHRVSGKYWESFLADNNCLSECSPSLLNNVMMGMISSDNGATYSPIYSNVASFGYVDSVQDFGNYDMSGNLLSWDWSWPWQKAIEPPYSDTLTIGIRACTKVIGAIGCWPLSEFILHRHSLTSRNGISIPDLYLGQLLDYDVGPNNKSNMAGYDASHSLAFMYDCVTPVRGWGVIKIPFGCGYEPLINVKTLAATQSAWNDSDVWLDSAYYWMSTQHGLSHQTGTFPCAVDPYDRDMFVTLQKETVPPDDSAIYAFALFGMPMPGAADNASSYYELADMANKWCGFGRGDVNNNGKIDLADIIYLAQFISGNGSGPYPFLHCGDVDADGTINMQDVSYLKDYYFNFGPCPKGAWTF